MEFKLNPFFQALFTLLIIIGSVFVLFGSGPVSDKTSDIDTDGQTVFNQKIYVAVEGEGKIAVIDPGRSSLAEVPKGTRAFGASETSYGIDPVSSRVIKKIDLGGFSPHNVQVSPDNKTVWVTGNSAAHGHSQLLIESAKADTEDISDEVIVIDPSRDIIIKRIKIKPGIHLAHVVLSPDSKFAYVTAQTEGVIYKIDARNYKVAGTIKFREGSEPHGLRISADGSFGYIAMLKGKSLGILDLKTDELSEISLGGAAVQTGVTPDNKYAVVSLYDTKQLAVYDIARRSLTYINLPAGAEGPIQMYSTPDSKFIYLADQGYYFGEPSSEWVYKIDLESKKVVKEIKAGKAPHGVVVSGDGKFVFITNLLSGDVSVIDTAVDREVKRIKVGKEPNGISIYYKN